MMFLLGLAAATAGPPALLFDCTVEDAAGQRQVFSVTANASGDPLSLDGSFALANPDAKLLERIGSYQGSRLRISKGGKDWFVILKATSKLNSAILIEEVLIGWPYQRARYAGICVANPEGPDASAVSIPSISSEKFRWVFWFVRFSEQKKVAEVSWRSQCRVIDQRGVQSQIGVAVRLSAKKLDYDATSPGEIEVTDPSGALSPAPYKGVFTQSMAVEHGSKQPGVMVLTVNTNIGDKAANAYAKLFLRDTGDGLSQQVVFENGTGVVASGFCDPLDVKRVFGSLPAR